MSPSLTAHSEGLSKGKVKWKKLLLPSCGTETFPLLYAIQQDSPNRRREMIQGARSFTLERGIFRQGEKGRPLWGPQGVPALVRLKTPGGRPRDGISPVLSALKCSGEAAPSHQVNCILNSRQKKMAQVDEVGQSRTGRRNSLT